MQSVSRSRNNLVPLENQKSARNAVVQIIKVVSLITLLTYILGIASAAILVLLSTVLNAKLKSQGATALSPTASKMWQARWQENLQACGHPDDQEDEFLGAGGTVRPGVGQDTDDRCDDLLHFPRVLERQAWLRSKQ